MYIYIYLYIINPKPLNSQSLRLLQLRLSESKDTEHFVELPLCEIIQKYQELPGGPEYIKSIKESGTLRL